MEKGAFSTKEKKLSDPSGKRDSPRKRNRKTMKERYPWKQERNSSLPGGREGFDPARARQVGGIKLQREKGNPGEREEILRGKNDFERKISVDNKGEGVIFLGRSEVFPRGRRRQR